MGNESLIQRFLSILLLMTLVMWLGSFTYLLFTGISLQLGFYSGMIILLLVLVKTVIMMSYE